MSEKLFGIGASNGIKTGIAYLYRPISISGKAERETIEESEISHELNRLEKTKEKSYRELELLIEKVKESLDSANVGIIKAQLEFLNDPAFYPEIGKKIEQKKYATEKAIQEVVNFYSDLFAGMKDEYFRERASDIKDIGKRLLLNLANEKRNQLSEINEKVILVTDDLTPSDTVQLNKEFVQAIITRIGGKTSHTAILARTLDIPAVLGMGENIDIIQNGDVLIIDGNTGICIVNPNHDEIEEYQRKAENELEAAQLLNEFAKRQAITKDGYQVEIAANIGNPEEAKIALEKGAEGIGLYRTEFLFMNNDHLPTEAEQYQAYRMASETMKEKPLIIRTLDIGGDKELSYLAFPKEMNPFLGYRAIRLTLDRKDIFITQLRAILRASAYGNIKIMFPMISSLAELRSAKAIYEEAKKQLRDEHIAFDEKIELGIMIEIPSAALIADQFAKEVNFFSIGTNDLVQYTLAVDRMNEKVAYLYDYFHPSVLQLIKKTIEASHQARKWTGMCGGMAGDPLAAPLLIGLGLDEWSMDAGSISKIKQVISRLDRSVCKRLVEEVFQLGTAEEIRAKLQEFHDSI